MADLVPAPIEEETPKKKTLTSNLLYDAIDKKTKNMVQLGNMFYDIVPTDVELLTKNNVIDTLKNKS